jgi:hypothetical protein
VAERRRSEAARHTAGVGFDPTRKHRRSNFDYFYVGAGVLVCVALVLWALFG